MFVRYSQRQFSKAQLHTRLSELILTRCCLTLLYTHTFNLQNVLKVEDPRSRLLENSVTTICICCCCWFICKVLYVIVSVYLCSVYTLLPVALTFVEFALPISYNFYSCSLCLLFLMLNDIKSFRFP